jgi:hypothetical protein
VFIYQVKTDYKETETGINQFWTNNQREYDALKETSSDGNFLDFFNKFDREKDIINLIAPKRWKI